MYKHSFYQKEQKTVSSGTAASKWTSVAKAAAGEVSVEQSTAAKNEVLKGLSYLQGAVEKVEGVNAKKLPEQLTSVGHQLADTQKELVNEFNGANTQRKHEIVVQMMRWNALPKDTQATVMKLHDAVSTKELFEGIVNVINKQQPAAVKTMTQEAGHTGQPTHTPAAQVPQPKAATAQVEKPKQASRKVLRPGS